jgi:putative ABC transport system permease protein
MGTLRVKLRREITAHKGQFAAVVIILLLGVAVFGAYYDAYLNLQDSYDRTFDRLRFAHLTVSGGDTDRFAAQARAVPGVAAVETRVVADVPLRVDGDHELLGRVVGLPARTQPRVNQVAVLEGGYLDPDRPQGILVEQHMADHFDLEPGDRLEIEGTEGFQSMEVLGVVASAEYLWPARSRQDSLPVPDNFGVVFAPGPAAAAFAGRSATPEALVLYQDGADEAGLRGRLSDVASDEGAGTKGLADRVDNPSNATLQADIEFFGDMAVFLPVMFLVAAGVATYVLLARKVRAELPVIGTMLALGCSRRQVIGQYLGYGAAAGTVAAIPGVALGLGLGRVMTYLYADIIRIPHPTVGFHYGTMAVGLVFGVGSALFAALAPALTASRVIPAEAGRTVAPPGRGRASLPERLLPPLRRLPIRWKGVLRGVERNWRRTIYTAVGVTMAVALVLASWAMLDSTNAWFDALEDTNRHDARVVFAGPTTTDRLARLAEVDGVADVERMVQVPAALAVRERRYQTVLVGPEADTRMHGFRTVDGGPDHLPERGVLAGVALRKVLDVSVGDEILLSVDSGDGRPPVILTERLAGFVNEPIGTFAYVSLDRLTARSAIAEHAGSALVTYAAGTDDDVMRRRLTALGDVAAVEENQNFLQAFESYMAFFYAIIGFMIVFGAAMALALIYASISVNIAERSVELATLRAEGVRQRVLSRLITAENLLVTLLGIPPGIGLGLLLAKPILATYTNDLWRFDLVVRPATPVLAALAICAAALVSQWPGLRAVSRLDLAAVVRLRSG